MCVLPSCYLGKDWRQHLLRYEKPDHAEHHSSYTPIDHLTPGVVEKVNSKHKQTISTLTSAAILKQLLQKKTTTQSLPAVRHRQSHSQEND